MDFLKNKTRQMTWVDFVSRDVWSFQSDKLGEDDLIYVYLHIYIYICMYVRMGGSTT